MVALSGVLGLSIASGVNVITTPLKNGADTNEK
jgi:hypothetical protein